MVGLAAKNVHHSDARLRAFAEWIQNNLIADGEWNDRKVVIFTEYEDTLQWMVNQSNQLN